MLHPFNYELPSDRIAQRPVYPPDAARMLVSNRDSASIIESTFSEIGSYLRPKDLLIFNNSKVIPCRLFGTLPGGGEAEILLLKRESVNMWRAMGRPMKKFKKDSSIIIDNQLRLVFGERVGEKEFLVTLESLTEESPTSIVYKLGCMPVPPYIRGGHSDDQDRLDYQSIFASIDGSVAAPTASLHFTDSLIEKLKKSGVEVDFVTLHVGPPSFLALWTEEDQGPTTSPGYEEFQYDARILVKINETRANGGRVIAVGTTVVRALESIIRIESSTERKGPCSTDLFITPGFEFRAIDGMVTNLHQPRTTHLLLVEAFIGKKKLEDIYGYALGHDFRFLSYGDGMIFL